MIVLLLGLLAGYAFGGIPWAYIIARHKLGIDIREHGSGNVGATNMWRVGGKKLGGICFALDIFKGWLPSFLAMHFFGENTAIFAGLGAILGHVFPIWLRGSGGKGVATATGAFMVLSPAGMLYALATFIVIGPIATRTVSAGAVTAAIFLMIMNFTRASTPVFLFTFLVCSLVVYRHKGNLNRLYYGTESRLWKNA